MGGRMVIVIEYAAAVDMQQALAEAMTQIKDGVDRLNPEHVKAVQAHVAIEESADQVLAVFDKAD